MPVTDFIIPKGPAQSFEIEPALNVNIRCDINTIIVIDKLVADGWKVRDQNQEDEDGP